MQQSPRMLKISAGNEEFGLCGKWLLHGFKIAKLNLQGNPRLMQRSLYELTCQLGWLGFPTIRASHPRDAHL